MELEAISIRRTPTLSGKRVQEIIAADPSIPALGELVIRDKKRLQPNAGRLDPLLQDPKTLRRFEAEIQLGAPEWIHEHVPADADMQFFQKRAAFEIRRFEDLQYKKSISTFVRNPHTGGKQSRVLNGVARIMGPCDRHYRPVLETLAVGA